MLHYLVQTPILLDVLIESPSYYTNGTGAQYVDKFMQNVSVQYLLIFFQCFHPVLTDFLPYNITRLKISSSTEDNHHPRSQHHRSFFPKNEVSYVLLIITIPCRSLFPLFDG
eukprot:TRINITY_DN168_c3_g1_i2.p1 TRINITY_DN168_c3_g1~~TRINITY_DN168_c3_g1_i2.p1  ORF type:complete len:112 (-),score=6.92 TRINITY_DN168_c3_g1_i2:1388-1723(-)